MITKNIVASGVICGAICVVFMWTYMHFAMNGYNMSSGAMGMNMSKGMESDMKMSDESMSMDAMMMHMNDNLKGKTGDELDKAFLADMIVHHQGAVDMAKLLEAGTQRPELKKFAQDIITAQSGEIQQMKAWQKMWFPNN